MASWLQENNTFYSLDELEQLHSKTKSYSMQKCLTKSTIRDELLIILKRKIGFVIDEKYEAFKKKNKATAIRIIVSNCYKAFI